MSRDKRALVLCGALLCLNIAFIWGNSLLPADASNAVSDGVMRWVRMLFEGFGDFGTVLLRKLGHITEFACLGLLLSWFWRLLGQEGIHRFTMPLLCGLLTACVDESIQIISIGRSSSLVDVWIDMGGLCAGMILLGIGQAMKKSNHTSFGGNRK